MSHRNDLFAAEALAGIIKLNPLNQVTYDSSINSYCLLALKYADKMEELRPIVPPAGSETVTTP